jgi:hypothetical protein
MRAPSIAVWNLGMFQAAWWNLLMFRIGVRISAT